jgi:hypothetical protein
MLFVVIVSWTLIVESASIALLALIFSTYFFPLCLNFLSRQDELFQHNLGIRQKTGRAAGSSCIGTHTDTRRVDHRQEHFLTALVVLGAVIAEPPLLLKDAL